MKFKEQREKRMKNRTLEKWDTIKQTNICMMWEPGEEREKGAEKVFEEIMAEKFPSLLKNINPLIQEAHLTPNRIHTRDLQIDESYKNTERQRQGENLENSKKKTTCYLQEHPNKINNWLLNRNNGDLKVVEEHVWNAQSGEKTCQPRILYPAKLSFKNECGIDICR